MVSYDRQEDQNWILCFFVFLPQQIPIPSQIAPEHSFFFFFFLLFVLSRYFSSFTWVIWNVIVQGRVCVEKRCTS